MANGYDVLSGRKAGPDGPADHAEAITPHDTDVLSFVSRFLYVGTGGDVVLRAHNSTSDVTFKAVPTGAVLPIRASHVRATGTTATDLVLMV